VNPRRRDFFPHRRPTYVAFDLLIADGVDLFAAAQAAKAPLHRATTRRINSLWTTRNVQSWLARGVHI
jgi:hypothetical protein